jgi:nuclear transport factor 2 (NTF2) superfamily protein
MDTDAAVRAWIHAWQAAWPVEDVELIAARYRPDALYRSHPFREPSTAREYVTQAFAEEKLIRCWFGEPMIQDDRAAVEYWAVLRSPDGGDVTIAGHSHLRFDEDGLVAEHRDYWVQRDGVHEPPIGWGCGSPIGKGPRV